MNNGIQIPHQKFILGNGLTLIVHEDHKAPIVAVNIWYHVGSKNEKPGKTGFAHLFEHLMFSGTEHFNDEWFKVFESIGASDMNGTTDYDRTNYFANVPVSALDVALWMESDRMGHLLPALTQAKLDEQRGVVQNELRQYENQPYGKIEGIIARQSFPSQHPYSWDVGGSIADLDKVTLEDARDWFRQFYNPANAVLVLAGDITANDALARIEIHFSHIPSASPISRHGEWIPRRRGVIRHKVEERAPQARLYKVWNVPPWGSPEGNRLRLLADLLGSGKNSRLYRRLVYEDQIATDVAVTADLREIAGQLVIEATARPDVGPGRLEAAIDGELRLLVKEGVRENEMQKVRVQFMARTLRQSERIGGFGGKSDLLAEGMIYRGDAEYFRTNWGHIQSASTGMLLETARKWLDDDFFVLEVHPFPSYSVARPAAERGRVPAPGPAPTATFPEMQHAALANGLKVILAERHNLPLVSLSLMVRAGFAADPQMLPGTASMTLAVLDEGTPTRDALKISEELESLGAVLTAYSTLDTCIVSLSALKANLADSLAVFIDVILHPLFQEKEIMRQRQQQLATVAQEQVHPVSTALRLLPRFLYGANHPYGRPLTGTGTQESLGRIGRDELIGFYRTWFSPDNSLLLVVGDIGPDEILSALPELASPWGSTQGTVPLRLEAGNPASAAIFLVDKADAPQSLIIAGQCLPPKNNPKEEIIETMNNILGENFTSRLNMNLREDKHWSYGVRSLIPDARGPRPFLVVAPVQTDRTAAAMQEIVKEIRGIQGSAQVMPEELTRTQNYQILKLPGLWETQRQILATIQELTAFDLPEDWYQTYPQRVSRIQTADIERMAREILDPDRMIWIVVGDLGKIEPGIRGLNWGSIHVITAQ